MAKSKLEDKVRMLIAGPDFVPPQVATISKSEYKRIKAEYRAIGYVLLAAMTILYIASGEAGRLYNAVNNHDWKAEYQNFKGFPQS
jgi:hypothetical protein